MITAKERLLVDVSGNIDAPSTYSISLKSSPRLCCTDVELEDYFDGLNR